MPLVVNSFSKYFAMTGWRLGWLLVPQELQRAVDRLTGNFTICPPVLSQVAAVAAFTPESIAEADGCLHHYAANRELLLDGLRAIGIDRLAPDRRRVLRLRRRLAFDHRLAVILLEVVGGHRCCHRPRHRLRHAARRVVRPAVVRRARRATSKKRCADCAVAGLTSASSSNRTNSTLQNGGGW